MWLLSVSATRTPTHTNRADIDALPRRAGSAGSTGFFHATRTAPLRAARAGRFAEDVRAWVAQGAAIYVCGSWKAWLRVDDTLQQILGEATLQQLAETGRYRRDVY